MIYPDPSLYRYPPCLSFDFFDYLVAFLAHCSCLSIPRAVNTIALSLCLSPASADCHGPFSHRNLDLRSFDDRDFGEGTRISISRPKLGERLPSSDSDHRYRKVSCERVDPSGLSQQRALVEHTLTSALVPGYQS